MNLKTYDGDEITTLPKLPCQKSNSTVIQDKCMEESVQQDLDKSQCADAWYLSCSVPMSREIYYGFSLMIKAESPSYIVDIVTTRLEADYRPEWHILILDI